jgi:iron(III) transport system substrate-binding protein
MSARAIKVLSAAALSAAVGLTMFAGQAAAQTELTVYTAIEADDLKRYAEEFNKQYPDIEIKWVRDSTGIVTAKLLAEKSNPQADIVWGLAATSLMLLKNEIGRASCRERV